MNEKTLAFLKQIQGVWAGLSNVKRIALVLGTVGVLTAVLGFAYVGSRETYTVLFADLAPDDAQAISAKLKELKVPAQVEAGGTAILVPEARVHELRLELAGAGLPRGGGVGFELFDRQHFGATELEQRINYRRALEGELARTIGTIAAVQSARVHLVLPERSVFARKEEASASVVLRLRPGRAFGKAEISGVVHLVAAAVPGLAADRVSIVGADGVTLHRPRAEGGPAGGELDAENEREVASGLEERARELLERTLGAGHADVRVSVDLDPSSRERTDEHYDPTKQLLRSEQKTIEKTTSEGPSVAGVPGAKTNLATGGGVPDPPDGELATNVLRQSWTRNWELDRVTEKTLTPAGQISRLSVAVLVDGSYTGDGSARAYVPRDPAELERLGELVKVAVGFSATRGDSLRIDSARFASEPVELGEARPAVSILARVPRKWLYVAAAGALLALASALVLVVRANRKKAKVVARAKQIAAPAVPAALAGQEAKPALPRGTTEEERGRIRTEALELAVRDPASAAVVLRGWLSAAAATTNASAHF